MSTAIISSAVLTQEEIDQICAPLKQGRAQVRFLRRLGLDVRIKPNGKPLVRRSDWEKSSMTIGGSITKPRWTVSPR